MMKSTLMSLINLKKICYYYYPLKVLVLNLWEVDPLLEDVDDLQKNMIYVK